MRKTAALLLVYTLMLSAPVFAQSPKPNIKGDQTIFYGKYVSDGRGCNGNLNIEKNSLVWKSQYVNCTAKSYRIIEETHNGTEHNIAYELKQTNKQCKVKVVELYHAKTAGYVTGWSVSAHSSLKDYKDQDNESVQYVCVLQKLLNSYNNPPGQYDDVKFPFE